MTSQKIGRIYDSFLVNGYPACIGNPSPSKLYGTRKVSQLTGDIDRETGQKTLNETGSRFGIYGTDLGVSFLHDGKLYFLFGDTNRLKGKPGLPASAMPGEDFNEAATDYDAIAYTTSEHAYEGIRLSFNPDFPHLDYVDQMTGEHPIEGISIGEYMYVFFTTDLYPEEKVPTRSILARSNDGGIHFGKPIYTLSTDRFIHVSAQVIDNHVLAGLPEKKGEGLLIWGTPKHRKSDIYLAYIPLAEITNRSSLRFFSGMAQEEGGGGKGYSKTPLWTPDESLAKPLFSAGCVGELSVRWNYYLEKWIMLFNCELCNTSGVIVRLADTPWGPWSAPRIIFDPEDGYGKFIHDEPGKDSLNDPTRDSPDDKGDEYGPYQMAPYSTGIKGRYTKIYFTLSTWNPYQVMQMSAIIPSEEEQEKDPRPYANSSHDRNDRKYAYISLLFAHMAKINTIDLEKNSDHRVASSYIADHIEWAQFRSHNQLRTEIKHKFRQLISPLSSDMDKAGVYTAALVAIARLTYDYSTFKNSVNEDIHKRWALDAIHTGHKEWLISEIEQAVDHEKFLLSVDHLCYAHNPSDSNEFKYARLSLLLTSNPANNNSGIREDIQIEGSSDDWKSSIAWARFRSVKEMRQDLLKKIQQMIYNLPTAESTARAYTDIAKAILELTDSSSYTAQDYSRDYEWAQSVSSKNKQEEIVQRISNLVCSDHFLIPIGQKSSQ
ncbi:MAG: DUF4185 domain-containing protein [Nitrososphaera sp.]